MKNKAFCFEKTRLLDLFVMRYNVGSCFFKRNQFFHNRVLEREAEKITGNSKMLKVSRSMKNVKHLDTILNWAVKNQVIFKIFDAE